MQPSFGPLLRLVRTALPSILVLGLTHLLPLHAADACCLSLPSAPANDADGVVAVTYGGDSLFTVDIQPSPLPAIPAGRYAAWCFDSGTEMPPQTTLYGGYLYSTCDPNASFNQFLPDHPNVKQDAATWKKINYLINHRQFACGGEMPTMWEVQLAIFALFGQPLPLSPPYPSYRLNVVQCLVSAANNNAGTWQLGPTDKVAVIFNIDVNWDALLPDVQLIFLEVPCPAQPTCKLSITKECVVPETPPTTPFDCSGMKPIDTLWVRWSGGSTIWVKEWNGSVGTGAPVVAGPIAPGDIVKFTRAGTFPNDVYFELFASNPSATPAPARTGLSTFHLSCSDIDMNGPEDCGKLAGNGKTTLTTYVNDWVFEGFAGNGKTLECAPTNPVGSTSCSVIATPMASCQTVGKPTSLTFRFTAGGCAASNNPQSGKFICSGAVDPTLPIVVSNSNGYAMSPSTVAPGDEFTVSAGSFLAQSNFTLSNAGGTETLSIHTSCSQPLAVGDVFGNLTLVGFNGQTGGSAITYRYTVKNEGASPLSNVYVTDDALDLGPDAGPFDLAAGETKVFEVEVQLDGTVTSTAVAHVQGTDCVATSSPVTVTVTENCPTPVPGTLTFDCSGMKPIDTLMLTWNGSDTIWVKAWNGAVGTGTPKVYGPIAPGNPVTFTRTGTFPNDIYFEIFASNPAVTPAPVRTGLSTFHLSCSDIDMNGPEDCGKSAGNGKTTLSTYTDTWIFRGMAGNGRVLDCSNTGAMATPSLSGHQLKWLLANTGSTTLTMSGLVVSWPAADGKLLRVKFDGDVIWDLKSPAGIYTITIPNGALTTDPKKKSINPGQTRGFILEFEKDVSKTTVGGYSMGASFGPCVLNL